MKDNEKFSRTEFSPVNEEKIKDAILLANKIKSTPLDFEIF